MATAFRTCNVCEAMCGMVLELEEGRITSIRPDPDDVFSRGHICPKGPAMREVLEDPDRLRKPLRRTASRWEEISWSEAFDEATARLLSLQREHGRDSVGMYVGNPTVHNHGTAILVQAFQRGLRTRNRFDANSQDANPKLFACQQMYGDPLSVTIPDVDRTDHFLMLGANPAASNGSVMTLGDVRGRLSAIRKRGGKIVLIDPRRTETAAWASEHHFIRPGADALFLLALLEHLFAREKLDEAAVRRSARGLDELRTLALRHPAERVAPAVGIEAGELRRIAHEFAAAKRACAYGRVGVCQNAFGATASWLVEALNVVTGNFDRAGGMMFPTPAADPVSFGRKRPPPGKALAYARWKSRVRGLPEFGGNLPAATMAEEMETQGPGRIRGFLTLAGNPVLSTPNGERLARALSQLDSFVAIDFYLNETTRHAHLILPPTHSFEQSHYDLVFHTLAVRNTAKYSPAVVQPAAGALPDWRILYELGMRMGGLRAGPPLVDRALRAGWKLGLRFSPDRLLDLLLRLGPHGDRFNPLHRGLNLRKLARAVHGIDLGPLQPCRARKVRTGDGLVELAPKVLLDDARRLEAVVERAAPPLVLIGRRHLRTNNSWMHNVQSLVKGPPRDHLLIHPGDAARLSLREGQEVRVKSRAGEVEARVSITADIREGVVSLPHGYGHTGLDGRQRIAAGVRGPNLNALTDDQLVEPLIGTAILNGVPVEIAAAARD
jgi:anaerobic selenocysteine-containing dehydrogenase